MRALRGWLERLGIDRREARAWALYDWANSAVYTTIVAALFPVYFIEIVAGELERGEATRLFGWTSAVAIGLVALAAPVLGTLADLRAWKKRLLAASAALGIVGCLGLFLVDRGDVASGLVLFGTINFGAAMSIVFYDALLPHVAPPGRLDQLSGTGYGLGYLGGGLLFLLHVLWVGDPEAFGLPGDPSTLRFRLAFLSVGLWWAAFSLPLLLRVAEPAARPAGPGRESAGLLQAFARLRGTLTELRRYRQAFRMLLAFLAYSDGIATVMRMAVAYATMRGFGAEVTIRTLLVVQFIGFPAALAAGRLARRLGPKRVVLLGLATYVLVCLHALSMRTPGDFLLLGIVVGTVQGGCQALGRSLFARFVPRQSSGEFFALLAVGEKFAGLAGPFAFSLALELLERDELAILTLIPFFLIGAWLLAGVDVEEGSRVAREAELAFAQCSAPSGALPSPPPGGASSGPAEPSPSPAGAPPSDPSGGATT